MAIDVSVYSSYVNEDFYKGVGGSGGGIYVYSGGSSYPDLTGYVTHTNYDASILRIDTTNTSQDTSIAWLDASTRKLFTQNITQDASLIRDASAINYIINLDTSFGGSKRFSNQIISDNGIRTSNYNQYYLGQGSSLYTDENNKTHLVIDNAHIRETLETQVSSVNSTTFSAGTWVISDGVTAIDTSTEGAGINFDASGAYFNVDPWRNSMQVGYLIRSKSQSTTGTQQLEYTVTAVNGGKVYINFPPQDQSTFYDDVTLSNVDVSTFNWLGGAPPAYQAIPSSSGQYAQTALLPIKEGSLNVSQVFTLTAAPSSGTVVVTLYDASGNLYATVGTADTSETVSGNVNIPVDVSLRVRNTFTKTTTPSWHVYRPDIINTYTNDASIPNVKGKEFGRVNGDFIVFTSDQENSPFGRYYKDVSSFNPSPSNLFFAEGNLTGIYDPDISVYGYGIYGKNAFFSNIVAKGNITAPTGNIAGFDLINGTLSAYDGSSAIILDSGQNRIDFIDASGIVSTSIHNNNISNITAIAASTEISYTGAYAKNYTAHTKILTYQQTDVSTKYLNRYPSGTAYLVMDNTKDASGYNITTIPDATYIANLTVDISSLMDVSANTSFPGSPVEGQSADIHTYSREGTFDVSIFISVYDSSEALLDSYTYISSNETGTISNRNIFSNRNIIPTSFKTYGTYFKVQRYINNKIRQKDVFEVYRYSGGSWTKIAGPYTQYQNNPVTYVMKVNSLSLNGNFQKTEIGRDGFLSYWNPLEYFKVSQGETNTIASACAGSIFDSWKHKGVMEIMDPSTSTTPAFGLLKVGYKSPDAYYVATFQNTNDTSYGYGLMVACGTTSDSGTYSQWPLRCFTSNYAYEIGGLRNNGGTFALYTSSDERLKIGIKDASFSALDILYKIPRRTYWWRLKDKEGNPLDVSTGDLQLGYISQEVEGIIPKMSVDSPDGGYKSIAKDELIVYLHMAILELKDEIKELKKKNK
jgi:hypothetical protein